MARKRQARKGFRRGERKRAPRELSQRIAEEKAAHPVTTRKMTAEEIVARRNGNAPDRRTDGVG